VWSFVKKVGNLLKFSDRKEDANDNRKETSQLFKDFQWMVKDIGTILVEGVKSKDIRERLQLWESAYIGDIQRTFPLAKSMICGTDDSMYLETIHELIQGYGLYANDLLALTVAAGNVKRKYAISEGKN